jgi:vacuolar-type H+-ATPase subunit H
MAVSKLLADAYAVIKQAENESHRLIQQTQDESRRLIQQAQDEHRRLMKELEPGTTIKKTVTVTVTKTYFKK